MSMKNSKSTVHSDSVLEAPHSGQAGF